MPQKKYNVYTIKLIFENYLNHFILYRKCVFDMMYTCNVTYKYMYILLCCISELSVIYVAIIVQESMWSKHFGCWTLVWRGWQVGLIRYISMLFSTQILVNTVGKHHSTIPGLYYYKLLGWNPYILDILCINILPSFFYEFCFDFRLFFYNCAGLPSKPSDLSFSNALPISNDFKFSSGKTFIFLDICPFEWLVCMTNLSIDWNLIKFDALKSDRERSEKMLS